MKKLFSLTLIFSLCVVQLSFAQEAQLPQSPVGPVPAPEVITQTVEVPAEVTLPLAVDASVAEEVSTLAVEEMSTPPAEPAPEEILPPQATEPEPIQETVTTQETVTADVLVQTENPETATEEASTTVAVFPEVPTEEVVVESETETTEPVPVQEQMLDVVADIVAPEPTQVPAEHAPVELSSAELEPEPEFSFALNSETIPLKKERMTRTGTVVEEIAAQELVTTVDNQKGEVNITGACADKYFVALLFRNEDDYRIDPASYIVNRAYECKDNAFSYSISELPSALPNGTYYLLVGEQGDTGAWKPITELTAITINKN